jgi:hypothetical protein
MARGNGSTRRGRPPKAAPDPGNFNSTELKKFEGMFTVQKKQAQEAGGRLSELFKACVDKGADRNALRFYAKLLQMPAARALDCFDRLRFYVETGQLSAQKDLVHEEREARRAARTREEATEAAI